MTATRWRRVIESVRILHGQAAADRLAAQGWPTAIPVLPPPTGV